MGYTLYMFLPKNSAHPLYPLSRSLRLDILEMINHAGFGHIGGSLSSLDILIALYNSDLFNFNKDHFILSAGHLCPALYVVLAQKNIISRQELLTYGLFASRLQGHSSLDAPGVEYASGALGQGLSFASGLALGDKNHHSVCLTTDGEHNEGQIWEAIAFASKYHQGNLINIIDCNSFQLGGSTTDIMPLGELASKYLHFGWTVTTINGHNFYELQKALKTAKLSSIYPACIIAKTVIGKGISFMENNFEYHDVKKLPEELYLNAKKELEAKK
jgi:transketolase